MGHLRNIRWVKDDNPASAINNQQNSRRKTGGMRHRTV
jgi:hypothetical protein